MHTISATDIMMIRVSSTGRHIFDFCSEGFSSLNDVIREVYQRLGSSRGLHELSVRNSTQGWSSTRALYL